MQSGPSSSEGRISLQASALSPISTPPAQVQNGSIVSGQPLGAASAVLANKPVPAQTITPFRIKEEGQEASVSLKAPEPTNPAKSPDAFSLPPSAPIPAARKADAEANRCTSTLFQQALEKDHASILRPDLSAFISSEDVVRRLLPYHAWNIPHADLLASLGCKEDPVHAAIRAAKRRKVEAMPDQVNVKQEEDDGHQRSQSPELDTLGLPRVLPEIPAPPFPSLSYASNLLARRKNLMNRFSSLSTKTDTLHQRAPNMTMSLEHLERLAYEDDRNQVLEQIEQLKALKAQLQHKEAERGLAPGTLSNRINLSFHITDEIEKEKEREREAERLKRQQERAAAKREKERLAAASSPSTPVRAPSQSPALPMFPPVASRMVNQRPATPMFISTPGVTPLINLEAVAKRPAPFFPAMPGMPAPSPYTVQAVTASPAQQSPADSLATPGPPGPRGRGRPRKYPPGTTKKQAKATSPLAAGPSTPLAATPIRPVPVAPLPSAAMQQPGAMSVRLPSAPVPQASPAAASTSNSSIPTTPIPLLIPVSALPRLTALSINPVPAAHVLPVIGTNGAPSGLSGLPLPADPAQQEPAVLLGITEAPVLGQPSSDTPKMQQILHVSVVLTKINPTQLSGLAALMQGLQAEVEAEKRRSASGTPTA